MKCVQLWAKSTKMGLDSSLANLWFPNWAWIKVTLQSGSKRKASCDYRKVIYFTFGTNRDQPPHWTVLRYWKICSWKTTWSLIGPFIVTVLVLRVSIQNLMAERVKNKGFIWSVNGSWQKLKAKYTKRSVQLYKRQRSKLTNKQSEREKMAETQSHKAKSIWQRASIFWEYI